jgi:hypothetical protein
VARPRTPGGSWPSISMCGSLTAPSATRSRRRTTRRSNPSRSSRSSTESSDHGAEDESAERGGRKERRGVVAGRHADAEQGGVARHVRGEDLAETQKADRVDGGCDHGEPQEQAAPWIVHSGCSSSAVAHPADHPRKTASPMCPGTGAVGWRPARRWRTAGIAGSRRSLTCRAVQVVTVPESPQLIASCSSASFRSSASFSARSFEGVRGSAVGPSDVRTSAVLSRPLPCSHARGRQR